jgi:cyclopropane fatty-acyl-phospholipid synthase-like methyltransferase
MKWRKPVFLREIKMVKINSNDKVLLIGCGILPTETILIAETTGVKVVGIDNSITAVKHAKKYVKKIGLSDLIKIEYADGTNYKLSKFNIIFIAINVFPIESILKHLSNNIKPGTKILCKSIRNDIYATIEKQGLSKKLYVIKRIENPKTQSFLLSMR